MNNPHEETVRIAQALVVKPGDKVLLALSGDYYDASVLDNMQQQLAKHFEGVTFVFVANVKEMAVEHAE